MKTAEEILEQHFLAVDPEYKQENLVDIFNEDSEVGQLLRACLSAMKMYAKQACKEQREICATTREEAEHANKGWRGVTVAILNAPEPELK